MSNIITAILLEGSYDLDLGLDSLQEKAYDRCRAEAEQMNLYLVDAIENLGRYAGHEPEPAEVAERLDKNRQGDWLAVTTLAAVLATTRRLEKDVVADLLVLENAIHEATLAGYEARSLYSSCACAWAIHDAETDLATGRLFEWKKLDAAMLRVTLSEGAEAWIDLAWAD